MTWRRDLSVALRPGDDSASSGKARQSSPRQSSPSRALWATAGSSCPASLQAPPLLLSLEALPCLLKARQAWAEYLRLCFCFGFFFLKHIGLVLALEDSTRTLPA